MLFLKQLKVLFKVQKKNQLTNLFSFNFYCILTTLPAANWESVCSTGWAPVMTKGGKNRTLDPYQRLSYYVRLCSLLLPLLKGVMQKELLLLLTHIPISVTYCVTHMQNRMTESTNLWQFCLFWHMYTASVREHKIPRDWYGWHFNSVEKGTIVFERCASC